MATIEAYSKGIFKGITLADEEVVASSLGCLHDEIPFIYLGLPVGKKMQLSDGSLPLYYLCRFFWGFKEDQNGMCWVKWKSILLESKLGGLGVGSLHAKNLSLLAKWKWRYLTEENALWLMVIKQFYGDEGGFRSPLVSFGSKGYLVCKWHASNGYVSKIYALESIKDCKIRDRWSLLDGNWGGNWEWRLPPSGRALNDIASLISTIGNLTVLSNEAAPESWSWSMDSSGKFKVNICVCRASLNRLATRSNLVSRGINIPSSCCPLCNDVEEDTEHILIQCPRVLTIWWKVWSWWHLMPHTIFLSFNVKDIALGALNSHGCHRLRKIIHGVFQCTLWATWKWRNKVLSSSLDRVENAKDEDIFPFIQRISKTWISARCSQKPSSWSCCISAPYNLFL
ncbi:RNA-directed DNA polymerase, eukaryota, reverse transcriptase zinc-binding domain protein [Tanacetum coccineum]